MTGLPSGHEFLSGVYSGSTRVYVIENDEGSIVLRGPDSFPRIDWAVFKPLPAEPDHPTRSSSRSSSSGSARARSSSCASRTAAARSGRFFDGPVTANKTLAVHTAWGRTLKDVFQRYKALRGFDQRYQNGFDCQGLWIEVGVERELGLNSKREIEEFGLEEFARRCREVVVKSSDGADARLEAARPVDGLGQRLLHVQRHEHRVHLALPEARARARLALPRPPLDRVVPALRHVALAARAHAVGRLPGAHRPVALRPLPAARPARRVARRLDDDAVDAAGERRRRGQARGRVRPARERRVGRRRALSRRARSSDASSAARSSSAGATAGPFDELGAGRVGRAPRRSRGTRSRSRRAPASSTSRPAAAARTSSSAASTTCRC